VTKTFSKRCEQIPKINQVNSTQGCILLRVLTRPGQLCMARGRRSSIYCGRGCVRYALGSLRIVRCTIESRCSSAEQNASASTSLALAPLPNVTCKGRGGWPTRPLSRQTSMLSTRSHTVNTAAQSRQIPPNTSPRTAFANEGYCVSVSSTPVTCLADWRCRVW
jgi:hypothetical protein